jgi:hypothetical protein
MSDAVLSVSEARDALAGLANASLLSVAVGGRAVVSASAYVTPGPTGTSEDSSAQQGGGGLLIIIIAAAAGGGGLLVIVIVSVVIYRRRSVRSSILRIIGLDNKILKRRLLYS